MTFLVAGCWPDCEHITARSARRSRLLANKGPSEEPSSDAGCLASSTSAPLHGSS
eukprot:CAMPEP_0171291108 /NCGR_PEP_ID=MMETSP0790-20130122/71485_1 /TAXON_ID=2925 /ORGANISM="Alexandrium catenella, Strain OF101" /LENGTH=54 /DNA_ID=CAMNT_0011760827 /DNA_START=37 /DNA_END=198 /DNA_ORIENTATION=-